MQKTGNNLILILLPIIAIGIVAYIFRAMKPAPAVAKQIIAAPALDGALYAIKVPESALAVASFTNPRYIVIGSGSPVPQFKDGIPFASPGRITVVDTMTWRAIKSIQVSDPVHGIVPSLRSNNFCVGLPMMSPFGTHYSVPDLSVIKPSANHRIFAIADISYSQDQARLTWAIFPPVNGRTISRTLPKGLQDTSFTPRLASPIALSRDGKLFATTDSIMTNFDTHEIDSYIYIINTSTGVNQTVLKTQAENALAFIPGNNKLVSIGGDNLIHVWNPKTEASSTTTTLYDGAPLWSSNPSAGKFDVLVCSPDGKEIAAADSNHFAVWDAQNGQLLANIADPSGYPSSGLSFRQRISFTGDSKYILVGNRGEMKVWSAPSLYKVSVNR